jgi:hypothetical protein
MRIFAISIISFLLLACGDTSTSSRDDFWQVELASQEQLWMVKEGLAKNLVIQQSCAVKSSHHSNAYYVGAVFTGPGIEKGVIGCWLISGEKSKPGIIQSVDGIAHNFTPYPKSSNTKAGASISDKEYKLVKKYLETHPGS